MSASPSAPWALACTLTPAAAAAKALARKPRRPARTSCISARLRKFSGARCRNRFNIKTLSDSGWFGFLQAGPGRQALRCRHRTGLVQLNRNLGAHAAAQRNGFFALHAVNHLRALLAFGHNPGAVEHREMLRKIGLRRVDFRQQLIDGLFVLARG